MSNFDAPFLCTVHPCIDAQLCQNGGTCNQIGTTQAYQCTCLFGFIGRNCEYGEMIYYSRLYVQVYVYAYDY